MTPLDLEFAQLLYSSAGLCRDVDGVAALSGGANSQVFEVRCDGREPTFVLKVFPEDLRWKMAKEAFVYGQLESAPLLPTPRILVADDSGRLTPEAYLIMTKLPGTLAASALTSLSEEDVAHVYEQIGSILHEFHQTSFDSFGYLWTGVVDPHPTNTAYMEYQFTKKLREFAEHGGDREIRRSAERVVEHSIPLVAGCSRAALCHDDLHEGNLLVLEGDGEWRVSGVLDVENAVAGDPLLDLAKTDYYAIRGDRVKRQALLDGYGPLPPAAEETMQLYRLYHAIELWDWFASIGNVEPLNGIAEDIRAFSLT